MRTRAFNILLDKPPGQHLIPCMWDAGSDENEPLRRRLHGEKEGQSSLGASSEKPVRSKEQGRANLRNRSYAFFTRVAKQVRSLGGGRRAHRNECMSKIPELVPSPHGQTSAQCYLVRRFLLGGLPAGAALSSTSRVARISRGKLPGRIAKDSRQGMGQTRTPLPPRRLTR